MKFSTRIDKEVTAERMFDALADFDRIERILMRRGVSVNRVDNISAGARAWDLAFDWRGQRRELRLVLVQFDRPERLALTGQSTPFDLRIDLSVGGESRHAAQADGDVRAHRGIRVVQAQAFHGRPNVLADALCGVGVDLWQ